MIEELHDRQVVDRLPKKRLAWYLVVWQGVVFTYPSSHRRYDLACQWDCGVCSELRANSHFQELADPGRLARGGSASGILVT